MVVLIDTNVAINFLTKRSDPQLDAIIRVMKLCASGEVDGRIAFHSLSIIWYVLRKASDERRRDYLTELCNILRVVSAPHDDVVKAIEQNEFRDFEDCLQDKCAMNAKANYIITCNAKDFDLAHTAVVTPEDFLRLNSFSNAEYIKMIDASRAQLNNGEVVHKTLDELRGME